MDAKTFGKRQRIAQSYASRKGSSQEAEDFSQYCMLRTFDKPHFNVEWLWVDYLRKEFGDTRRKTDDFSYHRFKQVPIQDSLLEDPANASQKSKRAYIGLSGDEIVLVSLVAMGWKKQDVGRLYGTSASRISQRLKHIKAKVGEYGYKKRRSCSIHKRNVG